MPVANSAAFPIEAVRLIDVAPDGTVCGAPGGTPAAIRPAEFPNSAPETPPASLDV
jgi:hypothetical protein